MNDKGKAPAGTKYSPRKQKMVRLSGLTEGLIAPALKQRSGYLRQLIANWPQILGDYALWAQPADIKMGRHEADKTILILSVHSSRGPEATARGDEFIYLVNRYFGFALIGGIRIKQDLPAHVHQKPPALVSRPHSQKKRPPSPQKALPDTLDEELSQALNALQKALEEKSS